MKKWIASALLYLAIVIAGYFIYDSLFVDDQSATVHNEEKHSATKTSKQTHNISEEAHGQHTSSKAENEINVGLVANDQKLTITMKDKSGNPVTDLEVNHEKLVHLIIVDEHLERYEHLHPKEIAPSTFEVSHQLSDGTYRAFVDIKSASLKYNVTPISFAIGNESKQDHKHASLQVDKQLVQTIDGQKVTLKTTDLVINQPVTLSFNVHEATLEPYLGAMGHVVILDEKAEQYLHVHPLKEDETIFETEFSQPGIYKIWAEFQQNGKVMVYSFVIKVK